MRRRPPGCCWRAPPEAVLGLAARLADDLPLLPPRAALAEEGRALARGEAPRARRRGPPDLAEAATVEEALLGALGHLLEVMLHHAPACRLGAGPPRACTRCGSGCAGCARS